MTSNEERMYKTLQVLQMTVKEKKVKIVNDPEVVKF